MIFPYYAKLLFPKPLIKYNSFIKAHSSEGKKKKKASSCCGGSQE